MTFDELMERTTKLLEASGYSNTERPYSPGALVNAAYREWVWETECNWEGATFVTVADQAEYDLPGLAFKDLVGVWHDGSLLARRSPLTIANEYPEWYFDASSTPAFWWFVNPKRIRLYPTPSASALTVTIYGSRLLADMASGDTPSIVPDIDHLALAMRAYWMEAETTVVGEERQRLVDQVAQYQKKLSNRRTEFGGNRLVGAKRRRGIPDFDRINT